MGELGSIFFFRQTPESHSKLHRLLLLLPYIVIAAERRTLTSTHVMNPHLSSLPLTSSFSSRCPLLPSAVPLSFVSLPLCFDIIHDCPFISCPFSPLQSLPGPFFHFSPLFLSSLLSSIALVPRLRHVEQHIILRPLLSRPARLIASDYIDSLSLYFTYCSLFFVCLSNMVLLLFM